MSGRRCRAIRDTFMRIHQTELDRRWLRRARYWVAGARSRSTQGQLQKLSRKTRALDAKRSRGRWARRNVGVPLPERQRKVELLKTLFGDAEA